jgi:DNA-binding transcriptional regulator of glucitol operon
MQDTDTIPPIANPTPITARRPALVALVAAAFVVCLALGYWQWQRFESASGTGQNLGYTFQWPLFAAFVVFAYRRYVQLEDTADHGTEFAVVTEIPADVLPARPSWTPSDTLGADLESRQLAEYNGYLTELAERDRN